MTSISHIYHGIAFSCHLYYYLALQITCSFLLPLHSDRFVMFVTDEFLNLIFVSYENFYHRLLLLYCLVSKISDTFVISICFHFLFCLIRSTNFSTEFFGLLSYFC